MTYAWFSPVCGPLNHSIPSSTHRKTPVALIHCPITPKNAWRFEELHKSKLKCTGWSLFFNFSLITSCACQNHSRIQFSIGFPVIWSAFGRAVHKADYKPITIESVSIYERRIFNLRMQEDITAGAGMLVALPPGNIYCGCRSTGSNVRSTGPCRTGVLEFLGHTSGE